MESPAPGDKRPSSVGATPLRASINDDVQEHARKSALRPTTLFVDDTAGNMDQDTSRSSSSEGVSMTAIEQMMKRLLKDERDAMQNHVSESVKAEVKEIYSP